ncbi:serine/threonine-protein kinase STY8 [Impatiens glandulifera]|uniref:serine/threonine-protein kinase STY8 n=1 Tax=Impatiens glandulifera TaxID=253017 RepID=UPI001FB1128B|nr:serine/threonine-protein kinase STY8 [Impatiens glandulifera]
MAAALECWSGRASTDEDMVEQVLMRTHDRSDNSSSSSSTSTLPVGLKDSSSSSSAMQKRFQKFSRNVSEAIASFKNSLNIDSVRDSMNQQLAPPRIDGCRKVVWSSVVRSLTQLYPGSQLPEKLVSNIRKHYDSMPLSYLQADFDLKEVFMHIKLIEQASEEEQPVIMIQEVSDDDDDEVQGSLFKLTFACNSSISWSSMSNALDSASISCKKIQLFEKKGFTLGVVLLSVQEGQDLSFKSGIENVVKSAFKKPKSTTMKLSFGLCGCQEETGRGKEEPTDFVEDSESLNSKIQLQIPLPSLCFSVSVDEWQTIQSGGEEIEKWYLNADYLEFVDQISPGTFKGVYKGKKVGIEKLRGCEKGNSYRFEIRKDLLELMTCGHKNMLQFHGVCIDEIHGLCVVTKFMEGSSMQSLILKNKKLQTKEIIKMASDVAEGAKFINDHGVAYKDLNTQRILLDRHGNACLGDMGVVMACNKGVGDAMEYETDGYRWLAPEIIAGDPESVSETWMSNVYSYGMVIWEMVSGEVAYSSYSPVQAAVGIAACGLRPEIPKDCPQMLSSVMIKCWNICPSKRPRFSEILSMLQRPNNNNTSR